MWGELGYFGSCYRFFSVCRDIILHFSVFSPSVVVSTSAADCLERLVSETTYIVLSGTLNSTILTQRFNPLSAAVLISVIGKRQVVLVFCFVISYFRTVADESVFTIGNSVLPDDMLAITLSTAISHQVVISC